MKRSLQFSHKILLAAALVVTLALAGFASFNAYLQRQAITQSLEASLGEIGRITAGNIAYWLDARVKLIDSQAQALSRDSSPANVVGLLEEKLYTSNFDSTYLGEVDGTFTDRPHTPMEAGYDARQRDWYKAAVSAGGPCWRSRARLCGGGRRGPLSGQPHPEFGAADPADDRGAAERFA
nr:hypothetical protein [Pseudomonas sp. BAV 4579]